MVEQLLAGLNQRQREAVLHLDSPLLVIAGAGSGKTRVITHKIAYLALCRDISPAAILGVTFTNKAATEMKNRIEELTGMPARRFRISTFHALGLRLLRENAAHSGFTGEWQVLDDGEQKRFFSNLEKNLPEWPTGIKSEEIRRNINLAKMKGLYPNNSEALRVNGFSPAEREIFRHYHQWQWENRLWDYEDLISLPVQLLNARAELRSHYNDCFQYIVIDEFQDTNPNQYELIRLLSRKSSPVTAVGDDDQSIYSWRGAEPRFLLEFEKDFPGARIIKLEQNYRSSATILEFANRIIAGNLKRRPKNMWTDAEPGCPVFLLNSFSKDEEATATANLVESLQKQVPEWRPIVVLYRVHAQSLAFENEFLTRGIPFQILKGLSFFERKEIKDAMALLRLALQPENDNSFARVCEALPLGIGPKNLIKLKKEAQASGQALFQAFLARPNKKDDSFFQLLAANLSEISAMPLAEALEELLELSGYRNNLLSKNETERLLNLEELSEFISNWSKDNPQGSFSDLLDNLTLNTPRGKSRAADPVFLASMHNAKGLEFPVVIAAGINSQYMPFFLSRELSQLEEERRLLYVTATRARHLLVLSRGSSYPSWFLNQVSAEHYSIVSKTDQIIGMISNNSLQPLQKKQNRPVRHPCFGQGILIDTLGKNKFLIEFPKSGQKVIDASIVAIEFL